MHFLPEPILFHPLKHHLEYIRQYIKDAGSVTETNVKASLKTIGSSQLDLYTGLLSPLQIAQEIFTYLESQKLLAPEAYRTYLAATKTDYQTICLSDKTEWVLRWGLEVNRFIHVHPARYADNTIRVKAAALKTAIAVSIIQNRTHEKVDTALVNTVRTEWLGLSKINDLVLSEGIGRTISLLRCFT